MLEQSAALAEKQELTAGEAAEVSQLWRKLVKLFHQAAQPAAMLEIAIVSVMNAKSNEKIRPRM